MAFEASKITATIVGRVGRAAEGKFDNTLYELPIAVGHRRKNRDSGEYEDAGTSWITVKANGDYGKALTAFGVGDLVKVTDAVLETREFQKKDGNSGLALDARFGTVELLEAKGDRPAATDDSW